MTSALFTTLLTSSLISLTAHLLVRGCPVGYVKNLVYRRQSGNLPYVLTIVRFPLPMLPAALTFRAARPEDLPYLVAMLADDPLGAQRECLDDPLPTVYTAALTAINNDPNNELVAACIDDHIVGMLQLTFIPYLTHQGAWRALIEGVRVHNDYRARGIGKAMFTWAIERARQRNCRVVQLTTDKTRPDAIRFYQQLGFAASHEGMKLHLERPATPSP